MINSRRGGVVPVRAGRGVIVARDAAAAAASSVPLAPRHTENERCSDESTENIPRSKSARETKEERASRSGPRVAEPQVAALASDRM
ncbi:hypothetical protein EVAR_64541_1 [Eumeta japonica]|uniref:Uncharacterized protein n=1 Tax=Eumeta variegata TaxID=151549 RepID=A0A4C1ZSK4_EUMVA|nr:hypothetical protein EVAR_64541_1 [Eumeta japonica]